MRGPPRARVAACVVAAAVVVGCVPPRQPLGSQCSLNSECDTPLVCRFGRCRRDCASARDCPPGAQCLRDAQGLGACQLLDELECARNSDCEEGLVCARGGCTHECATDRDCAPGSLCVEGSCEEASEVGCVLDSDCPEPLVCGLDDRCRLACRADRDCRAGETCESGACMRLPPRATDGGAELDAGATDAGVGDAGFGDAGADAGLDGGGAADGGVDAGPPDAGAVDAGPPECAFSADCMATGVGNYNGTVDCVAGRCVVSCEAGFGDCNGDARDGCESNLALDVDDCGACGSTCGAGEMCLGTACVAATVEELALGAHVSCARWSTGDVACWGREQFGELGSGTMTLTLRYLPVAVTGLTDALDLAVGTSGASGRDFGCAVRSGGTVVCWGDNSVGQLGDGSTVDLSATPVEVSGITDAVEVTAGPDFACARLSSGEVRCWGDGSGGALGHGASGAGVVARTPVTVSGLTASALGASPNGGHVCAARSSDGRTVCWGDAGSSAGTALGQTAVTSSDVPVLAADVPQTGLVLEIGGANTFAIDGASLVCWGKTQNGLCEPGPGAESSSPVTLPSLGVAGLSVGGDFAVAALADGRVHCWGRNDYGQCGLGRPLDPAPPGTVVPALDGVVAVAAGIDHACVARSTGRIDCAGINTTGQLGNPDAPDDRWVHVRGTP